DCLDLYGTIGNLRDLQFKEATDKLNMRTAQDKLRATVCALNIEQQTADALTWFIILRRYAVTGAQKRLRLSEVNNDIRPFTTTDHTGNDIAHGVLVIIKNTLFLELAQALHDCLTGSLRGNTT